MSLRIGGHDFEHCSYDEVADVLYLRKRHDQEGVSTRGTVEGHAVRLNAAGEVVGMTIVNARWLVERNGVITISVPGQRIEVSGSEVGIALEENVAE